MRRKISAWSSASSWRAEQLPQRFRVLRGCDQRLLRDDPAGAVPGHAVVELFRPKDQQFLPGKQQPLDLFRAVWREKG